MPIDFVKIDEVDRLAMDAVIAELRATGELGNASVDDLEVVMLAALLDGQRDASAAVKTSIALLTAEAHLRHERHLAPTASLRPGPEKPPTRGASWWGMLTTDNED